MSNSFRFDVLSLFPKSFGALDNLGVIARALSSKIADIQIHNPRDFTDDRYRKVDDVRVHDDGEGRPQARVVREEHGGRRLVDVAVRLLLLFFLFSLHSVLLVLEARVVLRVHGALDGPHFRGAEPLGLAHRYAGTVLTPAAAGVACS